jgi:hypothetical protein
MTGWKKVAVWTIAALVLGATIGPPSTTAAEFRLFNFKWGSKLGQWNAARKAKKEAAAQLSKRIVWQTDYAQAMAQARREQKMLLVYFRSNGADPLRDEFENSLRDRRLYEPMSKSVIVFLPLDAASKTGSQPSTLLSHPAFEELQNGPGVAMIDLTHNDQEYYGHVVSTLPLSQGKYYRYQSDHLGVVFGLPPGTLTQRTLVFAVRIHPERPASTVGELLPVLAEEAKTHSNYQAAIQVQGHHHWDVRFQRLSTVLPAGLQGREVCAESWPNERLVDAAVDCVDCWRQSSGHWSAVSAHHPVFGYDMRRGANGIWYATGVFGTHE